MTYTLLTELTNSGHRLRFMSYEAQRIGQSQRHAGLDPVSMLILYQREEIPDRVRDDFGASASIGLPGGIRALEPPEPIPNSAVK